MCIMFIVPCLVQQQGCASWRSSPSRFEYEEEEGDEDEVEQQQYNHKRQHRVRSGPATLPPRQPPPTVDTTRPKSLPLRHRTDTQVLSDDLICSAHRIVSAPTDREKVKTTSRIMNLASRYLSRKMATSKSSSTSLRATVATYNPYPHHLESIPRQHLSYLVRQRENGAWQATVGYMPFD